MTRGLHDREHEQNHREHAGDRRRDHDRRLLEPLTEVGSTCPVVAIRHGQGS